MKVTDIMHKTSGLPADEIKGEKRRLPLTLGLQFFADKGTADNPDEKDELDDEDPDDEENPEDLDEDLDLDELLKNPKLKAAHEAKIQKQLDRRLRKYKDVDPEEYRKLKAAADKGSDKKKADAPDDDRETTEKLQKAENRLKRAAVKEFAVDSGVDPVLLVRFIDLGKVELDEDGEPENLDELLEDLQESKYAKYFAAADEEDEEEVVVKKKKTSTTYNPGSKKQKTNKQQKVDPKELGRQKALARHKKKED